MLLQTKAIVLNSKKYSDSSLIVNCYTEELGKQSFFLKGILKVKKGGLRKAQFQPLTQLEISFTFKKNKSLHYIREAKVINLYQEINTRVEKSAVAFFLAEILTYIFQEEEKNEVLYHFLEASLIWFDRNKQGGNFHLIFMLQLSKYFGFFPNQEDEDAPYFDLTNGCFSYQLPKSTYLEGETLSFFKKLLNSDFNNETPLLSTRKKRVEMLNKLLEYYKIHLFDFPKINSLKVLSETFE